MIDIVIPRAVSALIDFSAQGGGAASQDGLNRQTVGGKDLCAKLPCIRRPMPVENLGQ
jgi:hypothetical protein